METKAVNIKQEKWDIYIGRPSLFGNPYKVGKDGDRPVVIASFRAYFYHRLETDVAFKSAIAGLKGKKLGCYCKPKPCHGDVIAEYLNAEANSG